MFSPTMSDMFSLGDDQFTCTKRKYHEDNDDYISPESFSRELITTPNSIETNRSTTTNQTYSSTSSITITSPDTSSPVNTNICQYTISSINIPQCKHPGTYKCSHCNISFCLQHGLKHQDELKNEIRDLLTKAQNLFDSIQKFNLMDMKAACTKQLDEWISAIHAKLSQIRTELQMTFVYLENKIQDKNAELKKYLLEELEHNVGCILTEQLHEFEVNKTQVEKANSEFIRLENIYNSFNNRALVTMVFNSDEQINLNPPSFVYSEINIDTINSSTYIPKQSNLSDQISNSITSSVQTNSNVTTDSTTTINPKTPINQHTEKTTDVSDINLISNITPDTMNLFSSSFDSNTFETLFDNITVEEMRTNYINTQQEQFALTTSQPLPHISNVNLYEENSTLNLSNQDTQAVTPLAFQNNTLTEPLQAVDTPFNEMERKAIESFCNELKNDSTLPKPSSNTNNIQNQGAQFMDDLLRENPRLIELDISESHITHEEIIALSNRLKHNQKLLALNLENNLIGHKGAEELSSALKKNHILQSLNLNSCGIENIGIKHLSKALTTHSSIKTIELADNQLEAISGLHLTYVLQENRILTTLNLRSNKIGETGAFYLGNGLQSNQTLRELDLSDNQLGDSGTYNICNALQNNIGLNKLNLSKNSIRKAGAQHICNLLINNTTLINLDCSCNQIESEGSKFIRDGLRQNKSLIVLNLEQNRIGQKGIKALIDVIEENNTLLELKLKNNNITSTDEARLNIQLKKNEKTNMTEFPVLIV